MANNKQSILEWLKPTNKALGDPFEEDGSIPVSKREYFSDGEELAEGSIEKIIEQADILKIMGIRPKITAQYPKRWPLKENQGYRLKVNGRSYTAWEKKHGEEGTLWGTATACFAAIVDDLLKDKGYDERVYILYAGGNEAAALIITPEQYKLLQDFGKESALTEQEISRQLNFDPRA